MKNYYDISVFTNVNDQKIAVRIFTDESLDEQEIHELSWMKLDDASKRVENDYRGKLVRLERILQ